MTSLYPHFVEEFPVVSITHNDKKDECLEDGLQSDTEDTCSSPRSSSSSIASDSVLPFSHDNSDDELDLKQCEDDVKENDHQDVWNALYDHFSTLSTPSTHPTHDDDDNVNMLVDPIREYDSHFNPWDDLSMTCSESSASSDMLTKIPLEKNHQQLIDEFHIFETWLHQLPAVIDIYAPSNHHKTPVYTIDTTEMRHSLLSSIRHTFDIHPSIPVRKNSKRYENVLWVFTHTLPHHVKHHVYLDHDINIEKDTTFNELQQQLSNPMFVTTEVQYSVEKQNDAPQCTWTWGRWCKSSLVSKPIDVVNVIHHTMLKTRLKLTTATATSSSLPTPAPLISSPWTPFWSSTIPFMGNMNSVYTLMNESSHGQDSIKHLCMVLHQFNDNYCFQDRDVPTIDAPSQISFLYTPSAWSDIDQHELMTLQSAAIILPTCTSDMDSTSSHATPMRSKKRKVDRNDDVLVDSFPWLCQVPRDNAQLSRPAFFYFSNTPLTSWQRHYYPIVEHIMKLCHTKEQNVAEQYMMNLVNHSDFTFCFTKNIHHYAATMKIRYHTSVGTHVQSIFYAPMIGFKSVKIPMITQADTFRQTIKRYTLNDYVLYQQTSLFEDNVSSHCQRQTRVRVYYPMALFDIPTNTSRTADTSLSVENTTSTRQLTPWTTHQPLVDDIQLFNYRYFMDELDDDYDVLSSQTEIQLAEKNVNQLHRRLSCPSFFLNFITILYASFYAYHVGMNEKQRLLLLRKYVANPLWCGSNLGMESRLRQLMCHFIPIEYVQPIPHRWYHARHVKTNASCVDPLKPKSFTNDRSLVNLETLPRLNRLHHVHFAKKKMYGVDHHGQIHCDLNRCTQLLIPSLQNHLSSHKSLLWGKLEPIISSPLLSTTTKSCKPKPITRLLQDSKPLQDHIFAYQMYCRHWHQGFSNRVNQPLHSQTSASCSYYPHDHHQYHQHDFYDHDVVRLDWHTFLDPHTHHLDQQFNIVIKHAHLYEHYVSNQYLYLIASYESPTHRLVICQQQDQPGGFVMILTKDALTQQPTALDIYYLINLASKHAEYSLFHFIQQIKDRKMDCAQDHVSMEDISSTSSTLDVSSSSTSLLPSISASDIKSSTPPSSSSSVALSPALNPTCHDATLWQHPFHTPYGKPNLQVLKHVCSSTSKQLCHHHINLLPFNFTHAHELKHCLVGDQFGLSYSLNLIMQAELFNDHLQRHKSNLNVFKQDRLVSDLPEELSKSPLSFHTLYPATPQYYPAYLLKLLNNTITRKHMTDESNHKSKDEAITASTMPPQWRWFEYIDLKLSAERLGKQHGGSNSKGNSGDKMVAYTTLSHAATDRTTHMAINNINTLSGSMEGRDYYHAPLLTLDRLKNRLPNTGEAMMAVKATICSDKLPCITLLYIPASAVVHHYPDQEKYRVSECVVLGHTRVLLCDQQIYRVDTLAPTPPVHKIDESSKKNKLNQHSSTLLPKKKSQKSQNNEKSLTAASSSSSSSHHDQPPTTSILTMDKQLPCSDSFVVDEFMFTPLVTYNAITKDKKEHYYNLTITPHSMIGQEITPFISLETVNADMTSTFHSSSPSSGNHATTQQLVCDQCQNFILTGEYCASLQCDHVMCTTCHQRILTLDTSPHCQMCDLPWLDNGVISMHQKHVQSSITDSTAQQSSSQSSIPSQNTTTSPSTSPMMFQRPVLSAYPFVFKSQQFGYTVTEKVKCDNYVNESRNHCVAGLYCLDSIDKVTQWFKEHAQQYLSSQRYQRMQSCFNQGWTEKQKLMNLSSLAPSEALLPSTSSAPSEALLPSPPTPVPSSSSTPSAVPLPSPSTPLPSTSSPMAIHTPFSTQDSLSLSSESFDLNDGSSSRKSTFEPTVTRSVSANVVVTVDDSFETTNLTSLFSKDEPCEPFEINPSSSSSVNPIELPVINTTENNAAILLVDAPTPSPVNTPPSL